MDRLPWRRVLTAVTGSAMVMAGCSDTKDVARATFEPARPGVLVVAAVLPAPGFWEADESGALSAGYEGELATMLADRFDLELEVIDVSFADLDAGRLGDADLALAEISITGARQDRIEFSVPYLTTDATVLGRSTGDELDDLAAARERTWAAVAGTTDLDLVEEVIRPSAEVMIVGDDAAAALAVADGSVDHALVDLHSAMALANADERLSVVARFDTDEQIAVAVGGSTSRQRSNRLAIDAALRGWAADGTLDDLRQRWLEPEGTVDAGQLTVIRVR